MRAGRRVMSGSRLMAHHLVELVGLDLDRVVVLVVAALLRSRPLDLDQHAVEQVALPHPHHLLHVLHVLHDAARHLLDHL